MTAAGQQWTYQDWNPGLRGPRGEPYAAVEARRRFATGEDLWVVQRGPDEELVVLHVRASGRSLSSYFLDGQGRPELTYLFGTGTTPGWPEDQLLLEQSEALTYPDDRTARPSSVQTFRFQPDGRVSIVGGPPGGPVERLSSHLPVDQLQTEPVPSFGAWEPFLRRER
ncbi:hypothetical protein [Vallicoccus soli]|uniref:Uncharacterized protein n=1 Tax=Vallicoccus soli TaxID=2339232 RepID=A0A3A3YZX4_9ACTN|nr:hypothetical protein [Vallicoccus soli]RJK97520.1 hypothetical protein D5H78_00270 [Vallicoccus soli]